MSVYNWIRGLFGRQTATADDSDTALNWSTLRQYARAATEFTKTPPVFLPRTSFARLSAMDVSDLPGPATLTTSDGFDLAFRHYIGHSDASTFVVLIHGSAGYGDQLHALASGIAASGKAQVFTLDMRGHGLSGGKPGHAVSHSGQPCEDIAEFIAFLDRTTPGARIILGGHSAGGGLVLRYCRSPAGRRISACLFLAPYLGVGSPTIRPQFGGWVRVRANLLRALALATVLGITRFNNTTVVSFDLTACSNRQSYTPSWSFNTLLAMGPGCWSPHATGIDSSKAVLVIGGDRDECCYSDAYREAFQAIALQAEVRTVENIGHWDVLVDPKTIAITTEWLSRVAGA
ncbi:MAG: alpha/beta hydrolase [Burkholderiales bacterium]